ncbi:hypothetical protein D3C80_2083320 [compost metagenome]
MVMHSIVPSGNKSISALIFFSPRFISPVMVPGSGGRRSFSTGMAQCAWLSNHHTP